MNQAQQIVNNIAFSLRNFEFPISAKKALAEIDQLYFSCQKSGYAWNPEAVSDITNQFIFGILDPRDLKRSRLSTGQKLQLAEILLSYLSTPGIDAQRKALFSTIFAPYSLNQGDVPLLVLSLVTSLAIVARNTEVLQTISLWMMSCGVDNPSVLYIAGDITKDLIQDENEDKYNHLPQTAFLFTSILLIAIGKTFQTQAPATRLITQVTAWVESCPSVCYIPPHTSIFELFRWILLSDETYPRLEWAIFDSISHIGPGMCIQVIPQAMKLIQDLKVKFSNMNALNVNNPEAMKNKTELLFGLILILLGTGCLELNEIHPLLEEAQNAKLPRTGHFGILEGMYAK